jgi:hypothetical protein
MNSYTKHKFQSPFHSFKLPMTWSVGYDSYSKEKIMRTYSKGHHVTWCNFSCKLQHNFANMMYLVENFTIIDQKLILPTGFYDYVIKRKLHGVLEI